MFVKLWDEEEKAIADEFLAHARAIRAERQAARTGRKDAGALSNYCNPGVAQPWPTANVSIDSPSYTLNHEEVEKASGGRYLVCRRHDAGAGQCGCVGAYAIGAICGAEMR
jgi:hypothetical protein